MALLLEISSDFGYVIITIVASFVFNLFLGSRVVAARKKYNVPYPAMYALESENKQANLFNCVQRGHQNLIEILPHFLVFTLIGGFQHPLLTSAFGVLFLFFRWVYFKGYSTGNPRNRFRGMGHLVGLFGVVGTSISFAVQLLRK